MGWGPFGGHSSVEERETLGQFLKRERVQKRISLRDLSKMTRVREGFLRAIEENRLELLPSSIYIKGFLSAYAKAVGLPPREVLSRYEGSLKRESVISSEVKSEKEPSERFLRNGKPIWLISGVIAISLLISYFLHPYLSGPPIESPPSQPEVREIISPLPITPTLSVSSVGKREPFSIELRAVEETWVQIQINGQPKREVLYKPGEENSFQALDRIELLVGNGGGLDIVFNGKVLQRFGRSGEVIRLVVTPEGVKKKKRGEDRSPQKD